MPERVHLTLEVASTLVRFALDCTAREYPNKLGQVLGGDGDLRPPRELHPAFYGCFDWHSAVHGHWTLVSLLARFPELPERAAVLDRLRTNLSAARLRAEVDFFEDPLNRTFERPYGWAWLLELAAALRRWSDPAGAELRANLLPLERLIAARFVEFLTALRYPVRAGEHGNTAFALSLAHDYAARHDPALARTIASRARDFYLADRGCPIGWEPGGFDFLSPCLQEAALMCRILPPEEFGRWFAEFLPGFAESPHAVLRPAEVLDASDGKLVHLDGLNFNRAWCLFELGNALGNEAMIELGHSLLRHGYARLPEHDYAGSHWLATVAVYALLRG
jgi:hypothetical protein